MILDNEDRRLSEMTGPAIADALLNSFAQPVCESGPIEPIGKFLKEGRLLRS